MYKKAFSLQKFPSLFVHLNAAPDFGDAVCVCYVTIGAIQSLYFCSTVPIATP